MPAPPSLTSNMIREIYAQADPRTQVRMRAALAATRGLPVPHAPIGELKKRLQKLEKRAFVLFRTLPHSPFSLTSTVHRLRNMSRVLQGRRKTANSAKVAAFLRANLSRNSDVFTKNRPPNTSSDVAYVLSYMRAANKLLGNIKREHKVSNADLSRQAQFIRRWEDKQGKYNRSASQRADSQALRRNRRTARRQMGTGANLRPAKRAKVNVSRPMIPGRNAPFNVLQGGGPPRALTNAVRMSAQHPAVRVPRF